MARSPKVLRKRYLSRPPVEPMRLRPGMSVVDLVDVYRQAKLSELAFKPADDGQIGLVQLTLAQSPRPV